MEKSKIAAYGILALAGIVVVGQVVRDQMAQPPAASTPNATTQTAPPPGTPDQPPGAPPPGAPPQPPKPSGTKQPDVTELKIIDLKKGTGATAKTGDHVSVHYVGTLTDGTKFDASTDRGVPFEFNLGGGDVIPGWDEGVVGMKVGGKRKLIIPPDKGYGPRGMPPAIPPNATLVFEIELLKVG